VIDQLFNYLFNEHISISLPGFLKLYPNHFPILSFSVPLLVAARISNSAHVNFFIGYPLLAFASMAETAALF